MSLEGKGRVVKHAWGGQMGGVGKEKGVMSLARICQAHCFSVGDD